MTQTQHTPGPWVVQFADCSWVVLFADCSIRAANGDDIANVCQYGPQSATPDSRIANARLIGAAPDLLERAKIALGYLDKMPKSFDNICAADHLRIAIAKAVGA